jgi:hypothetical protein
VADVLHLSCTPQSATLASGVVRAQPNGVHIAVNASDDVTGADIVTGSTPRGFFGVGVDAQEDGSRGIPIEPGSWSVGCYAGVDGGVVPSDIGTPRVAAFTVVDPDRLYLAGDLSCQDPVTTELNVTGSVDPADQDWDSIIADTVAATPGILPSDTVREAGYPDGPGSKDGPHLFVVRDGEVVAGFRFGEFAASGGSWTVSVDACTGTGIGVP